MIIHIHPETPQQRKVDQVVELLRKGEVIIYPTDTSYGMGCDISNKKAIDKVYALKKMDRRKPMSFVCRDLSHLSEYAAQVSTSNFRIMKRLLPGPYTFILGASREVPRIIMNKQRTVGIRVPDNPTCLSMIETLGHPILSTSIFAEEDEMLTDPRDLDDIWGSRVGAIVSGGIMVRSMSSVVDLTGPEPEVLREGIGDVTPWL